MSGDYAESTDDWERCPVCGRARVTSCPICETAGTEFIPADYTGEESLTDSILGRPTSVICPTCDEPFVPEFYRFCPWCEHDFGEGHEPDAAESDGAYLLQGRALLLMLCLFGLILALGVYFAIVI